jgi:hypothetical protein
VLPASIVAAMGYLLTGRPASASFSVHPLSDRATLLEEETMQRMIVVGAVILFSALLLILLCRGLQLLAHWLAARRERVPPIRFRGLELASTARIFQGISTAIFLASLAAMLFVCFAALLSIFG